MSASRDAMADALWTAEAAGALTATYRVTATDSKWELAADAILAASPDLQAALDIGLPFVAVQKALPEGWWMQLDYGQGQWRASAGAGVWEPGYESLMFHASTPGAALTALGEQLAKKKEAPL